MGISKIFQPLESILKPLHLVEGILPKLRDKVGYIRLVCNQHVAVNPSATGVKRPYLFRSQAFISDLTKVKKDTCILGVLLMHNTLCWSFWFRERTWPYQDINACSHGSIICHRCNATGAICAGHGHQFVLDPGIASLRQIYTISPAITDTYRITVGASFTAGQQNPGQ